MSLKNIFFVASLILFITPQIGLCKKAPIKKNISKINKSQISSKKNVSLHKELKTFNYPLTYSKTLESSAKEKIVRITTQLLKNKSIGQWIDASPKNEKLRRRLEFSQFTKNSFPKFAVSDFSILFVDPLNKTKKHIFSIYPDKSGLITMLDGQDISSTKNESFKNWKKRMNWSSKKRANALLEYLIPKAFADGGFDSFRFTEMLSLMSNSDWENFPIQNGLDGSSILADQRNSEELVNQISFLQEFYGLQCTNDGGANLTTPLGNNPHMQLRVNPRLNPNNRSFSIDLLNGSQVKGNIEIGSAGNDATVTQNGRKFSNESFLAAVRGIADGGDLNSLPETSPASGPNPVKPSDIMSAYESVQACQAMQKSGVADQCSEHLGNSFQYSICAGEMIKAGLPGGIFNRSPLKKLSREQALTLKIQLASIYHDYPVSFSVGDDFPSVKRAVGQPYPNYSGNAAVPVGELTAAFENDLDKNDPLQTAIITCLNGANNGNRYHACNSPSLKANSDLSESVYRLSNNLENGGKLPQRVSDLYDGFNNIISPNDPCYTSFVDNNMVIAMENYNKLAIYNSNSNTESMTALQVKQLGSAVDAARAICSNASLRQQTTEPRSGTKTSN